MEPRLPVRESRGVLTSTAALPYACRAPAAGPDARNAGAEAGIAVSSNKEKGDPMSYRSNRRQFLKQATVAGALGFDADQTRMHDAGYDIFLTRELFQHLLTRMHGIENIPTASKTCGDSQRALQGPRPKN